MIRNFVTGIVVGGVVAGAGLGVISQLTPLPKDSPAIASGTEVVVVEPTPVAPALEIEPEAAPVEPAISPEAVVPEVAAVPEVVAPEVAVPEPAVVPEVAARRAPATEMPAPEITAVPNDANPEGQPKSDTSARAAHASELPGAIASGTSVDEPTVDQPAAKEPAVAAPAVTQPTVAEPVITPNVQLETAPAVPPQASAEAPAGLNGSRMDEPLPQVQAGVETAPVPTSPSVLSGDAGTDAAPSKADLPPPAPAETAETLLTPVPEPVPAPPEMLVLDPAPMPAETVPAEPATGDSLPKMLDTNQPETLAPSDGLARSVDGVTTGRLPRIGAAESAGEVAVVPGDTRPLVKYAAKFSNDLGKPLFAVLLVDTGAPDLDRAQLAALPFVVSFVIDPLDPGAAAAEAIYRAAGKEVVMLASGIPAGATAGDLEQTFQANAAVLPEAVAVMDLGMQGFQDNRPLATMVVPIIKGQGRGLVTFEAGLNAADQVARREDVAAAVIFRDLDAEGEEVPLIRRYLDRAAFKAAQEGRVVVVGTTRPETIAALMEWTVEGKGASVALAPISAVLAVE